MNTGKPNHPQADETVSRRQLFAGAAAAGAALTLGAGPVLGATGRAGADDAAAPEKAADDIRELKLKDWHPQSMLKVKVTKVDKPAFPVFDAHNHLRDGKDAKKWIDEMDAAGVRTVVHLDGMWGDQMKVILDRLDHAYPGRFATFARIDFDNIDNADWADRTAKQLEESFKAGAKGLKLHKDLGLEHRYKNGKLVPVDDPKLDPAWEVCAAYHKPVTIHTADPLAFFTPLDQNNERWHELNQNPDWLFADRNKYPTVDELFGQFTRMIEKHPKTTYVGAHLVIAEDLALMGKMLDAHPNLYLDLCARISELGRQPYTARRFLTKYQDRILFGTDTRPDREAYRIYWRFFETDDEYFDCAKSHHLQGFWMIYGVFLPPEVLEKIYYKNADRLILGAKQG